MTDPQENVWEGDTLGREREGRFLAEYIASRHSDAKSLQKAFSLVLNIDGDWGYGKSFLIDRLARQLKQEGHIVARIDAWASDFAADPFLPVMAALEDALVPHLADAQTGGFWRKAKDSAGPILLAAGGGLLRGLANRALPGTAEAVGGLMRADLDNDTAGAVDDGLSEGVKRAIDTLLDNFARESLAEYEKTAASIGKFKTNLASVVAAAGQKDDVQMPMYIIIDELDRCRPSYAVAMLERIKHLFQIPDIVFLVATNTAQLQHSIGAVYGSGFDSARYLHRFFDMSYSLAEPMRGDFVRMLLAQYPRLTGAVMPRVSVEVFLGEIYAALDMSARDMEQCTGLLNAVLSTWPENERPLLPVLIPVACAIQLRLRTGTLKEAFTALNARMKNREWVEGSFRGKQNESERAGVLTVFERLVALLETGYSSLMQNIERGPTDAWIVDRITESTSIRRFSVEDYILRVRQVGRLFPKDA